MGRFTISDQVFGIALESYLRNGLAPDIQVHSPQYDEDIIPVPYLLRCPDEWPEIEKTAVACCQGPTLEVGALAGVHALELRNRGIPVTVCEQDPLAAERLESLGFETLKGPIQSFTPQPRFQHILMLMHGLGIAGTLKNLPAFLEHLHKWLIPGGCIIADSCKLDLPPEAWKTSDPYPGEVFYRIQFREFISHPFSWLYVDFETLQTIAGECGFNVEKLAENPAERHYLAKIWKT